MKIKNHKNQERGNYSASHMNKGAEYEESFTSFGPRNYHWCIEKVVLEKALNSINRNSKCMDFATGTGRVAEFLNKELGFHNVIGVDNSASMLQIAQKKNSNVQYILKDVRFINNDFNQFDVITAFRFFGKADSQLMKQAIESIDAISKRGTVLILNNHNSSASLTVKLTKLLKKDILATRYDKDILNTFKKIGFNSLKSYSIGILPQNGKKYYFGRCISENVERLNFKYFSKFHKLGVNNIHILVKD